MITSPTSDKLIAARFALGAIISLAENSSRPTPTIKAIIQMASTALEVTKPDPKPV